MAHGTGVSDAWANVGDGSNDAAHGALGAASNDATTPAVAAPSAAIGLPGATLALPAASAAGIPTLQQSILTGTLPSADAAKDPAKAEMFMRLARRFHDDPDISRMLADKSAASPFAGKNVFAVGTFFIDALLRVSAEDRYTLYTVNAKMFDTPSVTCNPAQPFAIANVKAFLALSDSDASRMLDVLFDMFKQAALQTPTVSVTPEQRKQAAQALGNRVQDLLKSDPDGTREIASLLVDPLSAPPEARCLAQQMRVRAVLATPEPYRDWAIVAQIEQLKVGLAAISQFGALAARPSSMPPPGRPVDFMTAVQRRVRANMHFTAQSSDLATTVDINCTRDGNLQSVSVTQSSGNADWDRAVLAAVRASDPMPRDTNGVTPTEFRVVIRSRDEPVN
ncbi:cell envelope integrity protein TolA [Pararobbsia silviterrae]|nr:energy transducer TonB [Pararobbsia silviterrae]